VLGEMTQFVALEHSHNDEEGRPSDNIAARASSGTSDGSQPSGLGVSPSDRGLA
jgi:hypothetical protein